ncbi:type ISP restriction/modification enzyme [Agrobacterium sp. DE0009]|uniref:type ISP restriction/modification enzyme n=1 Tax=Agrobacterium sp. DE0009 TaxID=2587505 RepID=UPI00119DD13D|nr:type ISP restriction/modification enzyme [Agrobacterium sp. DE0009]
MAGISAAELAKINSFPKLVDLLRDHLEWPIEEDYGFEDVVYEYEANELGLKPDEVAKIREIHQLRPLATSQPWGIFFISFEDKALSVTVLRRILKNLILKKRLGAQASNRQAWQKNDLIFAANFGNSGSRELAFVHFSDGVQSRDLPVMKVLGWNAKDTQLHNDYVGRTLAEKLRWPDDTKDLKKWREDWSSAFELRLNEAIRTSKDLALRLAGLATEIRARANELLRAETDRGPMRTMLEAFRKNLIHDLDEDGFADMFAQTIAYGMLAARISRPAGIVADNLADMVPKTNPFLKELFANFLAIGGHDKRQSLDFDELGVRDVVDMLNAANMEAVLRDFGDRNPKEDPVIHFYEMFLKEYDPQKRMQRGVFYTPRPVVNFIVRGVDEILRTEFGLPLGLADTSTWAEVAAKNNHIAVPNHVQPDTPFVQILDPATGTGTFLVEVIDLIHKRMVEHWQEQGKSAAEIKAAWNGYVPTHLLPRLTAFELMMAPYTIAHMKVGLKLSETGYTFGSEERARIFLTNALEPARKVAHEFSFMSEILAHEAQAANLAKSSIPYTAIVGNPPYSNFGQLNKSDFIASLLSEYKKELNEQKLNLDDDYIKFIRYCQYKITEAGQGCLGLITNNSYVDGVTHRRMRASLMSVFQSLSSINLHGSVRRAGEISDQSDENVFDIQQGVSLFLGSSIGSMPQVSMVHSGDLIGSRESKFERLLSTNAKQLAPVALDAAAPLFLFCRRDLSNQKEYSRFFGIERIFNSKATGIKTHLDSVFVGFDSSAVMRSIEDFAASSHTSDPSERASLAKKIQLVGGALTRGDYHVTKYCYRPFDDRQVFYSKTAIPAGDHRYPVMQHFEIPNVGLATVRQTSQGVFEHALAFEGNADMCILSTATKECAYCFPLWLKPSLGENFARPNIDRTWSLGFGKVLGLTYEEGISRGVHESFGPDFKRQKTEQLGLLDPSWDGRGDLQKTFGPRDLFDYIYAVLHSPGYRSRYAEFLKSDFPRIPAPATRTTFAALAALGRELVGLHLLRPEDSPVLKSPDIRFAGSGEARVEKGYPEYKNGKVMINASRWFEDVPKATWEFQVGGYQVCEKWLKDRAGKGGKNPGPGRVLTDEDILRYRRIVVALTETRRLMAEIDVEIDKHGGWPDAFVMGAGAN